jgi:GC-rich sequence DNA-binding factor
MSKAGVGPSTFDPESISGRQRYLRRIVKLVHNILKWRRYTKERDGLGLIVTGLVGDALFPLARSGWEAGGEEVIRDVRIIAGDKASACWQCL